jgi:DNA-binding NarL/FixJ family response regulator
MLLTDLNAHELEITARGPRFSKVSRRMSYPDSERKYELTSREIEILRLIGDGLQSKVIAQTLGISAKTVEFHKTQIYAKIGVTGAVGAVRFAIREGYLSA